MEPLDPALITAAVLAGGAGTRLGGSDKGLELLAGRALIAHVVDAIRGQAGTILISANRNRQRYAQFAPVCADATPDFHGPLAGISAALSACRTDWLLTVPVDSPRPPANLGRRLGARIGAARAAVAHDGEHRQPLFALYRRELAAEAAVAVACDMPVWRWHDQIGAVEVDFGDERQAFANLNTSDDFRRWEDDHRG